MNQTRKLRFALLFVVIVVILSVVLFSNVFAQEKKFATLGFKGIHLGMTQDEVNDVVSAGNGWSFKIGSDFDASMLYNNTLLFLNTTFPIGCRGQGDTEECYKIETVIAQFFEDRVVQISLHGPRYTATDIDSQVKGWARFGLQVLKNKFGNPSKVYLSVDRFNIFSARSGYEVYLDEWNKKDETILLTIGSDDFEYYAGIDYMNKKALTKIKQEKQKIKSGL